MGVEWRDIFPKARLLALSKTILLVLLGLTVSGGRLDLRSVGYLLLVVMLWALLYALNEVFDLDVEQIEQVEQKKEPSFAQWGVIALGLLAILWVSLQHDGPTGVLLRWMIVIQLVYSAPPVRFKYFWWFPVLTSGLINPVLRIGYGASLGAHHVPLLLFVLAAGIHFSGALVTREFRRDRDRNIGHQTMPEGATIPVIGALSILVAVAACVGLTAQGVLPHSFYVWGYVGLTFGVWYWLSGRLSKRADAVIQTLMTAAFPLSIIFLLVDRREIRQQWGVLALIMADMLVCFVTGV